MLPAIKAPSTFTKDAAQVLDGASTVQRLIGLSRLDEAAVFALLDDPETRKAIERELAQAERSGATVQWRAREALAAAVARISEVVRSPDTSAATLIKAGDLLASRSPALIRVAADVSGERTTSLMRATAAASASRARHWTVAPDRSACASSRSMALRVSGSSSRANTAASSKRLSPISRCTVLAPSRTCAASFVNVDGAFIAGSMVRAQPNHAPAWRDARGGPAPTPRSIVASVTRFGNSASEVLRL